MARKAVRYLTERQKAILEYIQEYQRLHGISPTHREICERFGYSSYGTVYKHLKLLQQKGYLHRDWNQKRGLELVRAIPGHQFQSDVPFLGLIAAGQPIEALPGEETLSVPEHLFEGADHRRVVAPHGEHAETAEQVEISVAVAVEQIGALGADVIGVEPDGLEHTQKLGIEMPVEQGEFLGPPFRHKLLKIKGHGFLDVGVGSAA